MEKLMFEFDEEKTLWGFTKMTPIEKMLASIDRASKAMDAEHRPCFKNHYKGYIAAMEVAIMISEEEEKQANLKMDFLERGPF